MMRSKPIKCPVCWMPTAEIDKRIQPHNDKSGNMCSAFPYSDQRQFYFENGHKRCLTCKKQVKLKSEECRSCVRFVRKQIQQQAEAAGCTSVYFGHGTGGGKRVRVNRAYRV